MTAEVTQIRCSGMVTQSAIRRTLDPARLRMVRHANVLTGSAYAESPHRVGEKVRGAASPPYTFVTGDGRRTQKVLAVRTRNCLFGHYRLMASLTFSPACFRSPFARWAFPSASSERSSLTRPATSFAAPFADSFAFFALSWMDMFTSLVYVATRYPMTWPSNPFPVQASRSHVSDSDETGHKLLATTLVSSCRVGVSARHAPGTRTQTQG